MDAHTTWMKFKCFLLKGARVKGCIKWHARKGTEKGNRGCQGTRVRKGFSTQAQGNVGRVDKVVSCLYYSIGYTTVCVY